MTSSQLRRKFLDFFEKKGHKIVPSSSLLPNDPSVLFTTAGMQQFKNYYLGEKSPFGKNVASCQKCVRTSDIEEVGDERHLTFFEMLGNFSFGGYFKEEAIKLAYEFIVKELKLKIDYVTVFSPSKLKENDWRKTVNEDKESLKIWQDLGVEKIKKEGEDNFWGPTGEEGPCGPTTEIYLKTKEGKSIEIWNLVFNEYFRDKNNKLEKLKQNGVDTGMGLERLAVIVQKKPTVFETDLFLAIIKEIEKLSGLDYKNNARFFRIIADHIKAAVFIAAEGIIPSNVERGYILRRLVRRIVRYGRLLKISENFFVSLFQKTAEMYKDVYPEIKNKENDILLVLEKEKEKFEKTLERGFKKFEKMLGKRTALEGEDAFYLYESFGFPLEMIEEIAAEKGIKIDRQGFKEAFERHQEISRKGAEKKFGGIGKEAENYNAVKLHTATHLLHQALREVLGKEVRQMGSDINSERLRFDFSFSRKLFPEEIKKIENLVNKKIGEKLEVKREEMSYEQAIKSGALAFFKEKYPEKVSVYSIGDFSKEICAGPHVKNTSELGKFRIKKEESSGAGIRRIKAVLE